MSPLPLPAPPPNPPRHCPAPVPHCCRHRIQARYRCPPRNRLRRARHPLCRPSSTTHHPSTEPRRSGAAEAGHSKCIVLVLCLAVCVVVWAHSGRHGAALGKRLAGAASAGRSRAQSGSCGHLTRIRARGRADGTSAPRRLSHAPGTTSHEICGAGAQSAPCDSGEVRAPENDGAVAYLGGVPAVGEERSQWRIAPSEPPETRIRCTECHARAVEKAKCQ
jgi:hypothetical protein